MQYIYIYIYNRCVATMLKKKPQELRTKKQKLRTKGSYLQYKRAIQLARL